MDYQNFVNCVQMPCCVIAVHKTEAGKCREIRILCANQIYKDMMGPAYYDNMRYDELVPKGKLFEEYCYSAACLGKRIHAYVETPTFGFWTDQTLIPLASDEKDIGYCQFVFELAEGSEADRMSIVSISTATSVVRSCIKLIGAEDFRKSVVSVLEQLAEETGATASDILLLDQEKQEVIVFSETRDSASWENRKSTEELIPYSLAITWEAMIGDGNGFIITDKADMVELEERNPAWASSLQEGGVETLVLIPLRRKQEVIGYLYVVNYDVEKTVEVKELLELTAFFLGAEIANSQLLEQLDEMSRTDSLTGLNNHNAMLRVMKEFTGGREKRPFGVVNIDLNGLKVVNDTKGHAAGDKLLIQAGEILRKVFYDKDVYRSGGDEFVVIIDEITEDVFEMKIEKLREASEKNSEVSFAIGSFWSDGSVDIAAAFHKADQTMYADKREYYKRHPQKRRM